MNIEKRHIPGVPKKALTEVKYVIAHEAGNPKNTGPNSLESEINFMTNNWRNAFTSDFVGSGGKAVELASPGYVQRGAGPKANPYAYAQVELSRTSNKETFKKDYKAWVNVIRKRAKEAGLPMKFDGPGKGIKSHEWITKNLGGTTHGDPFGYLASFGISRAQLKKDIENGVGKVSAKPSKKPNNTKGVETLAKEVIAGKWGHGEERKQLLGNRYESVQKRVNELTSGKKKKKPKKGVERLAKEVIDGKHGHGEARKKSLGPQYAAVQKRVNQILSGKKKSKGKSLNTLVDEVNRGLHGNGEARKKSLGKDYKRVQSEINRRYK